MSDNHEQHILLHLQRIKKVKSDDTIHKILDQCGLQLVDNELSKTNKVPITEQDCLSYLEAVQALMGEATYSFARVNFILAGCKCL